MSSVFGADYAGDYDALYRNKDYDAEVALIERLVARHLGTAHSVLDLGCGTGAHAHRLAARGFDVTGVDRSGEMLVIAREKDSTAQFVGGDVQSVRLHRTFDVALMMFAVLGYQTTDQAVYDALTTVRAHLHADGLFIADIWYGPAVQAIQPEERTKVVKSARGDVVRTVSATLDDDNSCASVRYRVQHVSNGVTTTEFEETHIMRYFFEPELAFLLERAGLRLLSLRAFDDADQPATEDTWNALLVARAV